MIDRHWGIFAFLLRNSPPLSARGKGLGFWENGALNRRQGSDVMRNEAQGAKAKIWTWEDRAFLSSYIDVRRHGDGRNLDFGHPSGGPIL
jgi:hypothetical protein